VYIWVKESAGGGQLAPADATKDLPQLVQRWFYIIFLPRMLVWPVLVFAALAVIRTLLRPSWKSTLLLGVLVLNTLVMSIKGSKEFRLWLPLLGALAPFVALGWTWLAAPGRLLQARRGVLALALVLAVPFALRELSEENTRKYGGYWQAMAYVNDLARETLHERTLREGTLDGVPPPLLVGSAYNWAVYMRQSPLVHLVKLPWQLNAWSSYDEASKKRQHDMDTLDELDVFIAHLPILANHPDLFEWVNLHYAVTAAFYDQATYEDLGPIFVLERVRGSRDDKRFFALAPDEDHEAYRTRWQLDERAAFASSDGPEGTREELRLLGFEYEVLPPQELGWITYHWTTRTGFARDYKIVDRLTAPDERNAWDNGHEPAYGVHPFTAWAPGEILREGYLVVAAAQAFLADGPYRPIGGGYRRADRIPIRLWAKLVEYDQEALDRDPPELVELGRLERANEWTGELVPPPLEEGVLRTPDGYLFSADGLSAVGAFMMPVQPKARVPDDGRPLPEDG
jgi:hypothetical protein